MAKLYRQWQARRLPQNDPRLMAVQVATGEQVQDVRQSIVECPSAFPYTCFHLEHQGKRVNDYIHLAEIEGFSAKSEMTLVVDPYTEKDARMHVLRMRELIGAAGDRTDSVHGALAGWSLYDDLTAAAAKQFGLAVSGTAHVNGVPDKAHAMADYDFDAPGALHTILPRGTDQPPKTVKNLSLSAWHPPPYSFRQRGHLLYLLLTTNEGDQYHITSCVAGFYVNRSSSNKFDPLPRPAPRGTMVHSLLTLLTELSPSFPSTFNTLQEFNARQDPLAAFQPPNAIPASPWFVVPADSPLLAHVPDVTRAQESYLISGVENAETLRDWNEEFQSTRELPRESVHERVFRERLTSKLFADYNEAAVRGAVLVARGEVPALNPTENPAAQIFLFNNVFLSYGADGAGTFASEGADEAARAATGRDVLGVRVVNQLDIDGLFTPGTVIVDYLGKRIVGQTIVPGIFKQRGPDEHQIDYGAVDGKDVVAKHEAFVPVFQKMSRAMKVKPHTVWDKQGTAFELESSVETKGLLGTDGRKYVLDLYRITPLDIDWIEKHWREKVDADKATDENKAIDGKDALDGRPGYPHRMTVLRPELVDAYHRHKVRQFVKEELDRRRASKAEMVDGIEKHEGADKVEGADDEQENTEQALETAPAPAGEEDDDKPLPEGVETELGRVDTSNFQFALNTDAFSGQRPPTEESQKEWEEDEKEVRAAGQYLLSEAMPQLIHDLAEGDAPFPMDGRSLSRLLHKKGINIRYLGKIYQLASQAGPRLRALTELAEREMISRAFKHVANRYLRDLPVVLASSCVAHLLNCLLGAAFNPDPVAPTDDYLQTLYPDLDPRYLKATPQSIQTEVTTQVFLRYRYDLDRDWASKMKHLQLLREVALKLGLQLVARDYQFRPASLPNGQTNGPTNGAVNGVTTQPMTNGHTPGNGKKKHKSSNGRATSPASPDAHKHRHTFTPDDVLNIVPVVKEASPRSTLAEETFEAVRISFAQDQKEVGQELLLETLSLHEQIYGILHPEVSRFYSQLSTFYYQLDEKALAVEIARKAVIVSERTLGIDAAETVLAYLNLGLFEHAMGNTKMALGYMRHALDLWKIVYGNNHPDAITTTNNIAVMLQQLKQYADSRRWFEVSIRINEPIFGPKSVNTATLLFQLAQGMALDHDSKGAVHRMRDAYNIFLTELGPEDKNTKEAESWLEQLTQNAVSIAKHAKDLQTRKIRRVHFSPHVTLGPRTQLDGNSSSTTGASGSGADHAVALDPRSIDELIKFIEGGSNAGRTPPKKRPTRSNPKGRGALAVGGKL